MRKHRNSSQHGFALVVVAALFVAFSVVAAVVIDRATVTQQIRKQEVTAERLQRITKALIKYSIFNNSQYPCPASTDVAESATTFGAAWTGASCGTTPGAGTAPTSISAGQIYAGMVPVRTLIGYGVDTADAYDAWNNRIMYYVEYDLTASGDGTVNTRFVVSGYTNIAGTNYTYTAPQPPDFIVLSFGRDAMGAIPKSTTSVIVACTANSSAQDENCDGDNTFWSAPINATQNALIAGTGDYYDDIIDWYRKD